MATGAYEFSATETAVGPAMLDASSTTLRTTTNVTRVTVGSVTDLHGDIQIEVGIAGARGFNLQPHWFENSYTFVPRHLDELVSSVTLMCRPLVGQLSCLPWLK